LLWITGDTIPLKGGGGSESIFGTGAGISKIPIDGFQGGDRDSEC